MGSSKLVTLPAAPHKRKNVSRLRLVFFNAKLSKEGLKSPGTLPVEKQILMV